MEHTISISDVSKLSGFTQRQLRNFHAKGYTLTPYLVTCGSISYRRYAKEHVENLKLFKGFLDEGFTLPVASQKAFESQGKEER
jgi:DNA-binding transcriptional MerR regulator